MGLQVYWYDFVCFGIVAASFCGALWVIWRREGSSSRLDDSTIYDGLLVAQPSSQVVFAAGALPRGHVGSSQLWTSCWKGVHPGWLLLTRSLSFLIMAAFLGWDVVEWDATIFVYYTEWTFTLVIIYFAIGSIVSAYGCWLLSKHPGQSDLEEKAEELKGEMMQRHNNKAQQEIHERAGFWGYIMQIAFQTCAGAVILTDIVFWCIILPFESNSHLGLTLLMGCMHTLNAFFLLVDTILNILPFPWFRLAYFVLWSCVYVIFQWIIHACGFSWWPYPFLELDTPWAPLWYFCLALIHIPCYGLYALIIKAKYTILPRLFPHAFVRSH
ncbi:uncharacterized protein LOC115711044 [Cannabis sativa]|uniref:uncharacterized protein LOC115711044 n=1 Tax=Cannabis sativa TaxID=3483 RepID=UPI0029CA5CF1|nr:uncharacterized protein LOC115711044 [Cannabis sativa]